MPSLGLDVPAGVWGKHEATATAGSTPLYVWLAFVLIGLGVIAYLTGYLLFEEIFAFLK